MSHSALLILGGGLVTCVLAALVFGPRASGEEKRIREERKLLRALEAQRRVHDRQRARTTRPRPVIEPAPAEPGADDARRQAEEARAAMLKAEEAERRVAERERRREEKAQAAARKAERDAERREQRRAEQERKAALKAERVGHRAAEQERKRREREPAEIERTAAKPPAQPEPPAPPVTDDVSEVEKPTPLTELPLYSWAHQIETDDKVPSESD